MKLLALFTLIFLSSTAYAQDRTHPVDTAYAIPAAMLEKSSSENYNAAVRYSKRSDTASASASLLKVNPYHLLQLLVFHDAVESIDTLFGEFTLTDECKSAVRQAYFTAYNAPKSEAYNEFRKMHIEDQETRRALEKCGDSLTCERRHKRMTKADSVHFAYLYNYVNRKGWPSREDGGYFAQLLALHDHAHHKYYEPFLKRAVINDEASYDTYKAVVYYIKNEGGTYDQVSRTTKKLVVDVSPILKGKMPSDDTIKKVQRFVQEHCPIRYVFYILYTRDQKKIDLGLKWWHYGLRDNDPNAQFVSDAINSIFDLVFDGHTECDGTYGIHLGGEHVYQRVPDKIKMFIVY